MSKRVVVLLKTNCPPNFAGETCSFPEDVAKRLIASGDALPVDKGGKPVAVKESAKPAAPTVEKTEGSKPAEDPDQLKFNPFIVDGLDDKLMKALAAGGLNDPEQLREYVASGKKLSDLAGIGEAKESMLLQMYCQE